METITVEIINSKAYRLLEDLAALDVIRLHKPEQPPIGVPLGAREFGFAKNMIRHVDDDFNEPLTAFSDYTP